MCVEAAALNLLMTTIAFLLPRDAAPAAPQHELSIGTLLEWRVLILSFSLFLYSFGYGGLTSFVALYTDSNAVRPRALYFTLCSIAIIATRPFIGRFADRVGYRRVFVPCVVLVVTGFVLLALGGSRSYLTVSALVFGTGFGSAYPVFLAHVLRFVDESRRGATFGSIIGAFDTGIGTGSIAMGWIIEHYGYQPAWATAAALAACAIPFFVVMERRILRPSLTIG